MKKLMLVIPLLLLVAFAAVAEFKLPAGVYRMDELGDARNRAARMKKPIAFLLSDESSSCPVTDKISLEAVKKFRLRTVVVYAHSKNDWNGLPETVRTAFRTSEAGKYIPKIVIIDPDFQDVLAIIPCVPDDRDRAKLFREKLRSF
jgi:Na+-translocating ferredoxin:NAD+ oxidoreductase RnfG subunit